MMCKLGIKYIFTLYNILNDIVYDFLLFLKFKAYYELFNHKYIFLRFSYRYKRSKRHRAVSKQTEVMLLYTSSLCLWVMRDD